MGTTITKNKKAYFDYEIIEKFEAGIALKGSEVKAIRASRVNLKDGFIRIIKNEMWLMNVHISHLETVYVAYKPNERRERKLLMHRKQINKIYSQVMQQGITVVPLSIYINDRNKIKVEVGLARGKNVGDKRQTIKKREADREARAAMKNYSS